MGEMPDWLKYAATEDFPWDSRRFLVGNRLFDIVGEIGVRRIKESREGDHEHRLVVIVSRFIYPDFSYRSYMSVVD